MIAIVSATRWPGIIRPTDWRWMNDGSWMRRRNGWSVPSLIAYVAYWPRGPSTAGVGAARPRPQQARQLGDDRPVGHLVEALVDDPQALLDLVDAEQVAGQAIALGPRRDVEVELGIDAVRVRPADVERDAGRAQVRSGHAHPQGGLAVDDARGRDRGGRRSRSR